MPSWSESNPPPDKVVTPTGTGAATIERTRRLLEQLFAGWPRDDRPPLPKR